MDAARPHRGTAQTKSREGAKARRKDAKRGEQNVWGEGGRDARQGQTSTVVSACSIPIFGLRDQLSVCVICRDKCLYAQGEEFGSVQGVRRSERFDVSQQFRLDRNEDSPRLLPFGLPGTPTSPFGQFPERLGTLGQRPGFFRNE
jgi:hypothetical protein